MTTPQTQCLLSPDNPALIALALLCALSAVGFIAALVALYAAYKRIKNVVDCDGLGDIFPDHRDHMRGL